MVMTYALDAPRNEVAQPCDDGEVVTVYDVARDEDLDSAGQRDHYAVGVPGADVDMAHEESDMVVAVNTKSVSKT